MLVCVIFMTASLLSSCLLFVLKIPVSAFGGVSGQILEFMVVKLPILENHGSNAF